MSRNASPQVSIRTMGYDRLHSILYRTACAIAAPKSHARVCAYARTRAKELEEQAARSTEDEWEDWDDDMYVELINGIRSYLQLSPYVPFKTILAQYRRGVAKVIKKERRAERERERQKRQHADEERRLRIEEAKKRRAIDREAARKRSREHKRRFDSLSHEEKDAQRELLLQAKHSQSASGAPGTSGERGDKGGSERVESTVEALD